MMISPLLMLIRCTSSPQAFIMRRVEAAQKGSVLPPSWLRALAPSSGCSFHSPGAVSRRSKAVCVVVDENGVTMNGGKLGGMVKVEDITTRLNLIEKDINNLKTVFTSWVPTPQDGGAALKSSVASWAGKQLTLSQRGDYEDSKVKH